MKRLFFLFAICFVTVLFSSCNKDDTDSVNTSIDNVETLYGTWDVINNFRYSISESDRPDFPQNGSMWNYIRVQFRNNGTYTFNNGSYVLHEGVYTYQNRLVVCTRLTTDGRELGKEYFKVEKCENQNTKILLATDYYNESGTSAAFIFQKK